MHILTNLQRLSRRIENLEAQFQDERQYLEKLIEQLRLLELCEKFPVGEAVAVHKTIHPPYVDRRTLPNLEKNLKISARRSFAWSYGKSAEEAHARAMSAVERRAKMLGLSEVPETVVEYINSIAKEYDQVKPKKHRRALGASAS